MKPGQVWRDALSNRWGRIFLALIAGAAAGLVHPPFNIWIGLIGYPVLMVLAERSATRRGAFGVGWLFGFAYFLIGCWWVAEAFLINPAQAWMAPFAASLLPAGIGLFTGAASALYRAFKPVGIGRFILFAALFSAFEFLRGHVLTGFPWNPVGASWFAGSAPSQFAAVAGVYGLGLVTLLGVCGLAPLLAAKLTRATLIASGVGLALLAMPTFYGLARLSGAKVEYSNVLVRLVQADVGQENKWTPEAYRDIVDRYIRLTTAPAPRMPDVVVWPESALPNLANNVFAGPEADLMASALQPGQTLLAGLSRAEATQDGHTVYYNSLFELVREPQGLRIGQVYDKHRLVPFGEYLPLGKLMGQIGIRSLVHMPADISAGPAPASISSALLPPVQPLICYESLFPGFTDGREATRPAWIVNVSNDAWFGQTSGPLQHLNLASFRAIETGLPVARATPTGVSAMVDPFGRVVAGSRIAAGEARFSDVLLPLPQPATVYGRTGDAPYLICLSLLIFVSLAYLRFARSQTAKGRV